MGVSIFNTGYDLQDQIDAAESAIAIVSIGSTHAAITSGQYVYVREHGTLAEGLYRATTNIAANATLSSSNVTAVSGGGLNALNSKIDDYAALNRLATVADCNSTTLAPGYYKITTATSNRPMTYGVLHMMRGNDYLCQMAIGHATSQVCFRRYEDNAWTSWEELALNSKFAWLTLSSEATTGTIPNTAFEAICYVFKTGTSNIIPVTIDLGKTGFYRAGQWITAQLGFAATVEYNATTRVVSLSQLYVDGANETSNAKMKITYR